jgi:hypothetical protein
MSIHWPCYCTVHVYVDIHVCDSMRWNRICAGCFIVWLQLYQEGIAGIPLTGLTPPQYLFCPNPGPRNATSYVVVFCVQWYKHYFTMFVLFVACLMVFNATFNNISVISWRSVVLVVQIGGPGENHRPVASHWQFLSQNVLHQALIEIRTHKKRMLL